MARRKKKGREVLASAGRVRLAELLTPPQWTQVGLATELGVTGAAVGSWLRRESRPSEAMRAKLERVAGIPAASWNEDAPAPAAQVA